MPTSNINSLLNSVPKLGAEKSDGTTPSYQDWKFAMMMVLRRAGSWEIMTKPKPTTRDAEKEWEKNAEDILTAIALTVDPTQYQYIADAENGVDAWKKLQKVYEKNSRSNRIALMRQFYNARHDTTRPIADYITAIIKVAARLRAIGVKLEDSTIMDVLIMNLSEEWSNIAASLSMTMDDLNVVSDVTGALIDEEGRRGAITDPTGPDHAMVVRGKYNPNITCYTCGKRGHIARRCKEKKPEAATTTASIAIDEYSF